MFDKILVAIDRSPANKKVFREALSLAKANQARLILLHYLTGEEEGSPILSLYPSLDNRDRFFGKSTKYR